MPLVEQGVEQLHQMKQMYRYPNVGLVFASPMLRALQTAEILYPDVSEKLILEDLREFKFGEFEGKSAIEVMEDGRMASVLDPASDFSPKGGESGSQFAERTGRALLAMLEHQAKHGITEAACVAHGGVILSMLSQYAMPKRPYYEWMSDNGAGFSVQASAAMLMRDQMVEAIDILPFGYSR